MTSGSTRRRGAIGRTSLLSGTHAATDFYQGSIAMLIPFLVLGSGLSYAQATGLVLATTLGSSIAQPLFGLLADRHETFWLIPASMVVAGGGIGFLGTRDEYWWALTMATVSGLGVAAYHPVAARLTRTVGGGGAQVMSWFILGGNVGLAVAPLVVAPLVIAHGLGVTPVLSLVAVVMAVAVVLSRRWLLAPAASARRAAPRGDATDDWRAFGWLSAVTVIRAGIHFGGAALLAAYVVDDLGGSQLAGAVTLTIFAGVGAAATIAGGVIADRWQRVASIRLGFVVAIPGLALIALAPNPAVAAVGAAIAGAGTFLPFAVTTTLGQEYLPNHIGTASGVTIGLAVSAGGALAPVLGLISDAHGPRAAMGALLLLPVLALLVSLRLHDRPRTTAPAPETEMAGAPS